VSTVVRPVQILSAAALVPIEQVVDADRQRLHVTIGDGDNVAANDGSASRHG
jgi:hypothetical protein